MTPMPNAPRTPLKSFRIPEDLYREAQQLAADEGQSVSDVVRKALERYVVGGLDGGVDNTDSVGYTHR